MNTPDVFMVLSPEGPEHFSLMSEGAHQYINEAIGEHDIEGAGLWVVRRYVALSESGSTHDPANNIFDLRITAYESLVQAAGESNWIPKDYYTANDWLADCREFLRSGHDREATLAKLLDEVRCCFTRDDDLPGDLLSRIDEALS